MSTIVFENGRRVTFKGTPTAKDVEEVAQRLKIQPPTQPTQPTQVPGGGFTRGVAKAGEFLGLKPVADIFAKGIASVPTIVGALRGEDPQQLAQRQQVAQAVPSPTGREVAGSVLQTALLAGTGGLAGLATLPGRIGAGAAIGGASGFAGGLADKDATAADVISRTALGTAIGAGVPLATGAVSATFNKIIKPFVRDVTAKFAGIQRQTLQQQFARPQQVGQAISRVNKAQRPGQVFAEVADSVADDVHRFNKIINTTYGNNKAKLFEQAGDPAVNFRSTLNKVNTLLKEEDVVLKISERNAIRKLSREVLKFNKDGDFVASSVDKFNQKASKILSSSMSKANQPNTPYDRIASKINRIFRDDLAENITGLANLNKQYSDTLNATINKLLPKLGENTRQKFIQQLFRTEPEVYHNALAIIGKRLGKDITGPLADIFAGSQLASFAPPSGFLKGGAVLPPRAVGAVTGVLGRVAPAAGATTGALRGLLERGARVAPGTNF